MKKKHQAEFTVPSYKLRPIFSLKTKTSPIYGIVSRDENNGPCIKGVVLDQNWRPAVIGPVYKNIDILKAVKSNDASATIYDCRRIVVLNYVDCRIHKNRGLI